MATALTDTQLAPELLALHASAEEARRRAYAPYSGFTVGAALLLADGSTLTAGNVENASYGLTICAERACVFRALAQGYRDFVAIAVAGPSETVSPCGACRQVLAEFMPAEALVVFPLEGEIVGVSLGDLLPLAFRPQGLLTAE
jgi:cytidine deaminase